MANDETVRAPKVEERKKAVHVQPAKKPKEPKPHEPGPNRAGRVLEVCLERGIKNPGIIWPMLQEAYEGSGKSVNYLEQRLNWILTQLRGAK